MCYNQDKVEVKYEWSLTFGLSLDLFRHTEIENLTRRKTPSDISTVNLDAVRVL